MGHVLRIGCHLSASRGFLAMGKQAAAIGANTFQFFTRNPRGGAAKAIDTKDIDAYLQFASDNGIGKIVAHAPYTLNLCSKDADIRRFAEETFADDISRMEYLPGNFYNFHPGSHVGQGVDAGIDYIAQALNSVLKSGQSTTVLLETMAGKGSEVGRSFEEIRAIIDRTELKEKIGVCLDTCHVWDAGYDIVGNLDGVLREFDDVIGLERLKAVHLNDSRNPLGSHKDRHEKIGGGNIGFDGIAAVITHPDLRDLPFNLETPNEIEGYAAEIAMLKEAYAQAL